MNDQNELVQNPKAHPPDTESTLAPASTSAQTLHDILQSKRPLEVIEDEILLHNEKTVENFIIVGSGLNEAKEIVEPGQWLKWLSQKIYISPREAQRYMQVAEAYKNYASSVAKLGLTKALTLLKIPDDEREAFINDCHEVADGQQKKVYEMSVRELKQVIRKKLGSKNKKTYPPIRRPNNQKIHNCLTSVHEQLNNVWSYLKEYAGDPDVTKEFHDSICSLSEVIGKCVSMVNSEASSETEIKNIMEGEKS